MTGTQIVQEIVDILVSGLTNFGTGIGTGISNFVQHLAMNSAGTDLSIFFIVIICFAAVSIAIGLTRLIYMFLTSLGANH